MTYALLGERISAKIPFHLLIYSLHLLFDIYSTLDFNIFNHFKKVCPEIIEPNRTKCTGLLLLWQSEWIFLCMHKQYFSCRFTQLAVRHHWPSLYTVWQSHSQQIYINLCLKFGYLSTKTIWMIKKAFKDDLMSYAQIKIWYQMLQTLPEIHWK